MKKKFAFILMGKDYSEKDNTTFETENCITYICTVRSFEEAYKKVLELKENGVGAIELCGAFGKERAEKIIKLTNNKVAVGYVVHDPKQDELFIKFFGN